MMAAAGDKIQLLVADDDPDILEYFRAIIKDPRYELALVADGLQAVEKAKSLEVDLAFIDVNMPGLDGIQTLIKWKEIQPKTQIVIISSYSDGDLVRKAIDSGAFTYLFKPLNKMDIFSVMMKGLKNAGVNTVLSR